MDQQAANAAAKLFSVIKESRALAHAHTKPIGEATEADYARRLKTILQQIEATAPAPGLTRIETYFSTISPVGRTFYKYRAILCRHHAQTIKKRLTMQDWWQKAGLVDVWRGSVDALEAAAEQLKQIHQMKRSDLLARSGQNSRKSRSKKNQTLPRNWADQILEKSLGHRFYRAILILRVTGCRPGEIHGAKFIYAENRIFVEIKGKKVTEKNGQPLRRFAIPVAKLPNKFLEELKGERVIELSELATEKEQKNFRMYLNRLGMKLFPDIEEKISPISFRHAMASALRDAGWKKAEMAGVMGHVSENTQCHYGARRRFKGKRPTAPVEKGSVQTARPVRKGKPSVFLSDNPPVLPNKRASRQKARSPAIR